MVKATLHGYAASHKVQEVLIAAKYAGVEVTLEQPAEHEVATLKTADGKTLRGSSAMLAHVAGKDNHDVAQWITLAEHNFAAAVGSWVYPTLSFMPYNKVSVDQARHEVLALLKLLDEYLLSRTYLVGERVTAADIAVSCSLLLAYQHVLEPSVRAPFVNVNRWFTTLIHQPHFAAVLGQVHLCEKAAVHEAKKDKKKEDKPAAEPTAAAPKPKEEAKPKEPKKKEEKKPKEPEPAEEMDETEAALAAEEPSKDPFEAFPKGTFNMDEFKRTYSNNDTLTVALPYFWDKFDRDHYSIWLCEYKYPKELSMVFMSCNLISGMFQRIEKMRKAAFGSMILFGKDNDSQIKGLWFWRSHELAFTLAPDWQIDYGSYEWTKLDPDSPDTKKKVKEYLAWEGDFDGLTFNQGKIFK